MNCDEVFEHLTLAAPTGNAESLAAHLSGCPRCRSLAETLEPALELFRASAETRPDDCLPAWMSQPLPPWLQDEDGAKENASALEKPARQRAPEPNVGIALGGWRTLLHGPAWPLVAAVLIGFLVGGAMWGAGAIGRREGKHVLGDGWSSLAGMSLSPACLLSNTQPSPPRADRAPSVALSHADLAKLQCCTACHAANRPAARFCAATQLVQSCQACHQP